MKGFKKCYANGGMITGPGTGTSDSIKKKVPEGSYIMPADSTKKIGGFRLSAMGKPMDVNVSNGEYEMPPEQVHAIGEQTLDQMRNQTHTPTGFKPGVRQELFFASGGGVKDPDEERKRREALGLPYSTQRQQALGVTGQRPASTLSPMPQRPAAAPVQAAPAAAPPSPFRQKLSALDQSFQDADFSSGTSAGKSFRNVLGRQADVAGEVVDRVTQPIKDARSYVGGFGRGLFGVEQESAAATPPTASPAATPAQVPAQPGMNSPQPAPGADLPAPQVVAPSSVQNNDARVADWIKTNSQPASGDLNAKNTVPVAGVAGLNYAGNYDGTDVFRGKGASGEAAFSDMANLATTRGGAAADLPKEGEPGYGNQVVNNDGGRGFDLAASNAEMQKANDIRARMIDDMSGRGDKDLRARARRVDPVGTYQAEMQNNADSEERGFKNRAAKRIENLYTRYDNAKEQGEKESILAEITALTGGTDRTKLRDNFMPRKIVTRDEMGNVTGETTEIVDLRSYDPNAEAAMVAAPTAPPANHVAALKKNPDMATQFDEMYGPGAAARILGE